MVEVGTESRHKQGAVWSLFPLHIEKRGREQKDGQVYKPSNVARNYTPRFCKATLTFPQLSKQSYL